MRDPSDAEIAARVLNRVPDHVAWIRELMEWWTHFGPCNSYGIGEHAESVLRELPETVARLLVEAGLS